MPAPSSEHSPQITPVVPTDNLPEQSTAAAKLSASLRKIEANRKNALRSTGPKTPRGKNQSRRNAQKHGLLAREIVLGAPDGFAGQKEFMQLLDQLREDHAPVGVLEDWQVQRIAVSLYWQSIVLRAQMGKFWKQNFFAKLKSKVQLDQIDRDARSGWEEMRSIRDSKRRAGVDPGELTNAEMETITNLHKSIAGAAIVCSFLDELSHTFKNTGVVTNEQQEQLKEHLGHEAESLLLALFRLSGDERKQRERFILRLKVKSLRLGLAATISDLRSEPEVLDLIPLDEKADLLMRYYVFYSREADRAVAELEHLQRMRLSRLILPPVQKNVLDETSECSP